jgi:drug/metabolite transporter (DMT)-like permease
MMHGFSQMVATIFALGAVFSWGTSDFLGGFASKRSDAFVVALLAHASGFALMTTLAKATGVPIPSHASQAWALAAGALGGTALAVFYGVLASGNMGLVAPVAAVLAAAIPTAFSIATEGIPGVATVVGFLLAALGIWLISRPEGGISTRGLPLALLAGLGFAGFFLCISRTGNSAALWSASESRFASFVLVGVIVLLRGGPKVMTWDGVRWGLFAGCLDSTGTFLFIRAQQSGRLDSAVVLASLYPAVTVLLARIVLKEHFTRWKAIGMLAALAAVPLIAAG